MKKVLLITICLMIMITSIVYANVDTGQYDPGKEQPVAITKIGKPIVQVFKLIGTMVAIGTLLVLAMRLAIASPSEKADIKTRMAPYLIGAVMLFTITHLLDIVYNVMNS